LRILLRVDRRGALSPLALLPHAQRGSVVAGTDGDAMFDQLMSLFKSPTPEAAPAGDTRIAVAVLLLEAAHRDDHFSPEERSTIERLLTEKFSLTRQECEQLMQVSEAASERAVQLHPYTQTVFQRMNPEERIQVVEMLWEVVYADGVLDPEEDALIRRLGGLIYVTDRERMLAKQRVLARLAKAQPE
jgi:uncharacterized tellurite resistance protein B-like protein